MAEYRYIGMHLSGRIMQGVVSARGRRAARHRVEEIALHRKFRVQKLERKATYIYRVRKGQEAVIRGEQKAFSADEIRRALEKMGFKILSLQRKLLDFKMKPPSKDIVMFIRLSADLLREKMAYDEILFLLGNDITNHTLKQAIQEINQDLKDGKDGAEVFGKQADVIGRFPAQLLGVATKSGNMAEIYESTAKFVERNDDFKRGLRAALIMPGIVVIAIVAATIFYVAYIFPETAKLFTQFDIEIPPMTKATLDMSNFLQANFWWMTGGFLLLCIIFARMATSERGKYILSKYMIRIPVIGTLLHKISIEIWCRVFYSLYSGAGENVDAIRTAAEACRNPYMEKQIKDIAIPLMLKEGMGLVEALEQTGVFTRNALQRLHAGTESGTVREMALQVANYYERETSYKLQNVIDMIQVAIAMLILVLMTAITVVSAETAFIKPKHTTRVIR
jgi:type IV pilus assembly protein PilC